MKILLIIFLIFVTFFQGRLTIGGCTTEQYYLKIGATESCEGSCPATHYPIESTKVCGLIVTQSSECVDELYSSSEIGHFYDDTVAGKKYCMYECPSNTWPAVFGSINVKECRPVVSDYTTCDTDYFTYIAIKSQYLCCASCPTNYFSTGTKDGKEYCSKEVLTYNQCHIDETGISTYFQRNIIQNKFYCTIDCPSTNSDYQFEVENKLYKMCIQKASSIESCTSAIQFYYPTYYLREQQICTPVCPNGYAYYDQDTDKKNGNAECAKLVSSSDDCDSETVSYEDASNIVCITNCPTGYVKEDGKCVKESSTTPSSNSLNEDCFDACQSDFDADSYANSQFLTCFQSYYYSNKNNYWPEIDSLMTNGFKSCSSYSQYEGLAYINCLKKCGGGKTGR